MSPIASYAIQTLVTLLGVVALAAVVLYAARRLGVGQPTGPMSLVGRLPLDHRRAIYLVRVGEVVFVVGASEGGLNKLGEIPSDHVPEGGDAVTGTFADALARAIGRGPSEGPQGSPPGAGRDR